MSLFISSLNSGSNGNCYYVGDNQHAVLIDAGISCRETEMRMKKCGLEMNRVRAVFVSHEHSDHINGLRVLARKYRLPVYSTAGTWKASNTGLSEDQFRHLKVFDEIQIGTLKVRSFSKQHDAVEPVSFVVTADGINIGIFTDIGSPCEQVINHFSCCHAAFLETNYDEKMLEEGSYPIHLKKRIRGNQGHLSNHQALNLFLQYRHPFLSLLLLSHLSQHNNTPEVALQLFLANAGNTRVAVAPRNCATEVYEINCSTKVPLPVLKEVIPVYRVQGTLF